MPVFGRLDLESLWMALQPIMDLDDGRVLGHEVLVRGAPDSPWRSPAELSAQAAREGRERELEARCRSLGLQTGAECSADDQRLFLNVDLRHAGLGLEAPPPSLPPGRVVLEICEGQSLLEDATALAVIDRWRREGYLIALDDYGSGYAGLGTLLAIQPHVIKIDRSIAQAVDHDARHQRAVAGLVALARDLGIEVVAEGVETREQLAVLRSLGVVRGQGFLLGRPERHPAAACPSELLQATAPPQGAPTWAPVATDGVSAEVERAFQQAVTEAVGHGVYYVDRRRTILRWNSSAESITGYRATEMVGRQCMRSGLAHLNAAGLPLCHGPCPLIRTMADGNPRSDLVWIRHREGHLVPANVRTSPILDEGRRVVGAVEVFLVEDAEVAGPPPEPRFGQAGAGSAAAGAQ